jgi:hypothetical protein
MHGSRAAAVPEKIKTNAGQKARKRTSIVGGKSRLLLAYFREGQTKSSFISGYRKFVSDTTQPTVDDDAAWASLPGNRSYMHCYLSEIVYISWVQQRPHEAHQSLAKKLIADRDDLTERALLQ